MSLENIISKFIFYYVGLSPKIVNLKSNRNNIVIVTQNNEPIICLRILKKNKISKYYFYVTPEIQKQVKNFLGVEDEKIIRSSVINWFKAQYNITDSNLEIFITNELKKIRNKVKEAGKVSPW